MSVVRNLAGVFALFVYLANTAGAVEATLEEKLQILQQEIDSIKAQLAKQTQQQQSQQAPQANPSALGSTSAENAGATPNGTTVGGYGEFAYNKYRNSDVNNNQADLRRFVLFFGHRFNDNIRFYSELEFEHAVVSADDKGEAELEQAFIDYRVNDALNFKAGLFLIPLGILNETHEPPTYYGVERNFVETRIIPTTWREGGLQVYGQFAQGLQYQAGITTGFDAGKIENPAFAIRDAHQELQLANAYDLSVHGALNYRVPGILVGGGVFTGNSGQNGASNAALKGVSARVTLWDVHARYFKGNWDLQTLYTRGTLGDAAQVSNALVAASGDPTLIAPKVFDGGYVQAAYHVWKRGDTDLAPFIRFERINTQKEVAAGFTPNPLNDERVITAGLNFKLHPQVVLKADYQKFHADPTKDRFNLGLGYMF
jgi:phosphate-selective porin O/P